MDYKTARIAIVIDFPLPLCLSLSVSVCLSPYPSPSLSVSLSLSLSPSPSPSLSLSLPLPLSPSQYMYTLFQMLLTYTIEYNRYTKHCNSLHPIVTTTHRHTLHPKHMYITPCHMHGTCSQEHMEVKGRQYQGSEMAKEQESNCKLKERNTYNCTDLD